MKEQIVLITGATGGIGKATAIELARQNFTVIVHGRDRKKTQQVLEEIKAITGNEKIDLLIADLFLMKEVRKMADELKQKYNRLDVLINNAGGIMSQERATTSEGHETTMAVNLFAPFLLTGLLIDFLKKSPDGRVINVSSNSHKLNARPNFQDLELTKGYNPLNAYGNSKLFLIWITGQFAAELQQPDANSVTFNSMHPGAVASNFGVNSNLGGLLNFIGKLARPLFKTVEQGADTIVYLASSTEVKNITGAYFVDRKQAKVATKYDTAENRKAVWDYCMLQTKAFR